MSPSQPRLYQQPWPEGELKFFQLGFVVDDLVPAAHRWAEVFGVGPFHVLPAREVACTYRGEPSSLDMQVAVAQAGPVQVELIHQRDDRPSVFTELGEIGRSGFHQVCAVVDDHDATVAAYAAQGYEVACEIPGTRGAPSVAYVDTFADFGFFTEVVQADPTFLRQLQAVADTCAAWDGTDPVRQLTRDGYVAL
jgi:hypothetical protein